MITSIETKKLHGIIQIGGDKSISHRALILGSISTGCTNIENLSTGADVMQNINILRQLGVRIVFCQNIKKWKIYGLGLGCFLEPRAPLNMGNSGTCARLIAGLLSSYKLNAIITGDESLKKRPMDRILQPLSLMGGQFTYNNQALLPIVIKPNPHPTPINYEMKVPSAQVKSAIMLAALNTAGQTRIIEHISTRNHSELMFKDFGANIKIQNKNNSKIITIEGLCELKSKDITIAGDFSSAAFLIVAALLVPNSEITIKNIGVNPTRIGLLHCLKEMGAKIELKNHKKLNSEPICDIIVKSSELHGITVPSTLNATMIDEFPILAIAASLAKGKTSFIKVSELKYKESNRLLSIAHGLKNCNIKCNLENDNLHIWGSEPHNLTSCIIKTYNDHRIAMSFLILSLCSQQKIYVDDISMIKTSFSEFFNLLKDLGAQRTENG